MTRRTYRSLLVGVCTLALSAAIPQTVSASPQVGRPGGPPHQAVQRYTDKNATAYGTGGAVSSVDPEATHAGLEVLARGGNAVDAAVATAAALGVTEPYSTGIGGGGYFVYYNGRTGKVSTLDGRESAPASMPKLPFNDPATGVPYRFTPELVTSGVSVGVPGTAATWQSALDRWGTLSLAKALKPAEKIAERGFVVDATFQEQTKQNIDRFDDFSSTSALYLPGGQLPAVGSIFRNPDLAHTYKVLGQKGIRSIYGGRIGAEIVAAVHNPPTVAGHNLPVPAGYLERSDLAKYRVIKREPTKVNYRGLDVYGMAPSSSGGSTVGEALNILGTADLSAMSRTEADHYYLYAAALAFADRGAYVGDPKFVNVPLKTLLSKKFAESRACQIDPTKAPDVFPLKPGDLGATGCSAAPAVGHDDAGTSTSHLVTADRWGNVVSYTLTIEQTGGSGIVVPGRGFLLNNELTDFNYGATYDDADPNRVQPNKRPRSSMSPTIILKNGKPVYAIGSPGGSTIITTVLQTLVNRIDLGMTLPQAVAAPRVSSRNTASSTAEPEFIASPEGQALLALGWKFTPSGDSFTLNSQIGAIAALEFFPHGRIQAVAEPVRRGGGDARVLHPFKT